MAQPISLSVFASVSKYEPTGRVDPYSTSAQAFAEASSAGEGGFSSIAIRCNASSCNALKEPNSGSGILAPCRMPRTSCTQGHHNRNILAQVSVHR